MACGPTPLAPGRFSRIAIIAETAADARDVLVEGESGILAVHPEGFRPLYEPSKRRLTWPNSCQGFLYNAVEPDQLRGPQHDGAYCDELCKWQYAREMWDMLQFGLRLGDKPLQLITTTPRPLKLLKEIMQQPTTVVTRGSTTENRGNLPPPFFDQVVKRYDGTRLGRQELEAEILEDNPHALWSREQLDKLRIPEKPKHLQRIVVGIDPSGTRGNVDSDKAADVGIVVAGVADGQCYVLADRTCNLTPAGWGWQAVKAFHEFEADRIVAERNFGGSMVEHVIRTADPRVSFRDVSASRGKWVRAEPVAALYEQGKVHHVGSFPALEDEMVTFSVDGLSDGMSPNRLDALVWVVTDLMLKPEVPRIKLGGY
jgi:phage terminase large subunit-like protein